MKPAACLDIRMLPALVLIFALVACERETKAHRDWMKGNSVMEEARIIDSAIDQYALEYQKVAGDSVSWADLKKYIKSGTRLYDTGGKDFYGGSYVIERVGTLPKISPDTLKLLNDVAPEFWSPYYQ